MSTLSFHMVADDRGSEPKCTVAGTVIPS